MVELVLERAGEALHRVSVIDGHVRIGRAPGNELVVADPTVSSHHVVVWREPGTLWVKDLGSSNGTFINERRIKGMERLRDADTLRLGLTCRLRVMADVPDVHAPVCRVLEVEDRLAGTRFPVRAERFVIGSAEGAELRVAEGPAVLATLVVRPDGEVRILRDDNDLPLLIGEDVDLGGRLIRVHEVEGRLAPTVQEAENPYPYRLSVTLEGALGAEAVLEELSGPKLRRFDSGNRAVLLYLLGRRLAADQSAGVEAAACGWCPDDEIMSGIWGRAGDENKLNVLLHRVRADLRAAGFDPWFIEKKQRYVRARLPEVRLR